MPFFIFIIRTENRSVEEKMAEKKKGMLVMVVLVFMMSAVIVSVSAVTVDKYSLESTVEVGELTRETLRIGNNEDASIRYKLTVKGNHSDWFNFSRDEFVLQPKEAVDVVITIAPPRDVEVGDYNTKIGIRCLQATAGAVAVGTGVLIPTEIHVMPPKSFLLRSIESLSAPVFIGIIGIVAIVILIAVGIRRRKKQ